MTRSESPRIRLIPRQLRTIHLTAIFFVIIFAPGCSNPKDTASTNTPSPTSATSPSTENFEGVVSAKVIGINDGQLTYSIKGSLTRMETSAKHEGQPVSGIMIMDLKSGTQTILLPQNKTYMTVNLKEMADKKGGASGEGETKKMPKLTPTGKQETIAGFTCEHWLVGDEQDTDLCVAKGFGIFGFGDEGQSGGPWRALKNLNFDPNYSTQLASNPDWKRFTEGGMFPLRISKIEKGQTKTVMEVTNVERKKLDDSLFKTPSDYKKIEIPGMPSGAK